MDLARLRRFAEVAIDAGDAALPRARWLRDAAPPGRARSRRRRGRAARQRGHRQIRGAAARRLRRPPALPRRLRGARRHEPRRPHAPLRAAGRPRARLRPVAGAVARRPPRPAPARAAAHGRPRLDPAPARDARPSHPPAPPARRLPAQRPPDRGRPPRCPADQDTVEVRAGRAVRHAHQPAQALLAASSGSPRATCSSTTRTWRPCCCRTCRDRAMVMKRYPHGADGDVLLHEARAVSPRPDWIETCADRARLGQRDRLPDRPGPAVAALGGQPRLHRPQPVVRPLRRRGPPRLPALRPRSR